jgi:hypothetical protein
MTETAERVPKNKVKSKEKKPSPPTSGLAIAGAMWIWGALLMYAPSYLGIVGGWEYLFYIPGFVSLIISLAGALMEIGKLRQSEGLSYWGASLVFLLPAFALYLLVYYQRITGRLILIAKIAVLLLAAFGVPFVFLGISHFFWSKETPKESQAHSEHSDPISKVEKAKPTLEVAANILVAMLALATAIVTLVDKIIP